MPGSATAFALRRFAGPLALGLFALLAPLARAEEAPERAPDGGDARLRDRLSVHGYMDLQYGDDSRDGAGSFVQNEVSVFLRATSEDERWTAFSEIEFDRVDGDAFLTDRGGKSLELEVETAWLEYRQGDRLRLRAGKLLLPQYWQTFHYPNLTLSTLAPLMSGNVFPKSIAALQLSGDWWSADDRGASYAIFLGRGGDTARVELEQHDNFAAGGRVTLHLAGMKRPAGLDTFDVSLSALAGQNDRGRNEIILGLDTQIRSGRFEVLMELARGNQPRIAPPILPEIRDLDGESLGLYVQAAFRLAPRWHVFYRYDLLDLDGARATARDEFRHTLGLNYRPRPKVSLKVEAFQSHPEGDREDYTGVAGSVVFNF